MGYDGDAIDDMLVTTHSTRGGARALRLHLHGNPWLIDRVQELLEQRGFTREALGGAADVWPNRSATNAIELEAISLLPEMPTERGAIWLLRQARGLARLVNAAMRPTISDERVREVLRRAAERAHIVEWFRKPLRVLLLGAPNVGKSTLINALTREQVALVSPKPGTTRDYIEAPGEIVGFPVIWIDSAGVRETADAIEQAGIAQTRRQIETADIVIWLNDARDQMARESPIDAQLLAAIDHPTVIRVDNKIDLLDEGAARPADDRHIWISARDHLGLENLTSAILRAAGRSGASIARPSAFMPRHVSLLRKAESEPNERRIVLNSLLARDVDSACS
jgi:small GTP-binding protein